MTPTPEQIEAAARAIFENMSDIDGDEADWIHFRDDCMEGAKAALTAAAGVESDPRWMEIAGQGVQTEFALRKELLTIEARTIEDCAQVADSAAEKAMREHKAHKSDEYGYLWCHDEAKEIAAAIRALKDKP